VGQVFSQNVDLRFGLLLFIPLRVKLREDYFALKAQNKKTPKNPPQARIIGVSPLLSINYPESPCWFYIETVSAITNPVNPPFLPFSTQ